MQTQGDVPDLQIVVSPAVSSNIIFPIGSRPHGGTRLEGKEPRHNAELLLIHPLAYRRQSLLPTPQMYLAVCIQWREKMNNFALVHIINFEVTYSPLE